MRFSDQPTTHAIEYPAWFKRSFLDLREDLNEALAAGKRGIIVYFAQANCGYCAAFVEHNLGRDDVTIYLRRHFDVVALDIWGERQVTDLDGDVFSEREFSILHNANFTPSFLFYVEGPQQALLLRGYHPPYRFLAALRFVGDGTYQQQSFAEYIERGEQTGKFEQGGLNERDFFIKPPYVLDRSRVPAHQPLLVVFESRDCHACDVMHSEPFSDPRILERLRRVEVVQFDMKQNTPVITPLGGHTTARDWARRLGVAYAPTLIFFDDQGHEIIRLDSIVKSGRMERVFDYVLSGAFHEYNYQQWLARQRAQR